MTSEVRLQEDGWRTVGCLKSTCAEHPRLFPTSLGTLYSLHSLQL